MRSLTYRYLAVAAAVVALDLAAHAASGEDFYDDTVYRTIQLTFADADWQQQLADNWEHHDATGEDIYVPADLLVDGVVYPDVGVQYKGNSSYWFSSFPKKPFKITMDAFVEDQEVYGFDKITLNNGAWDATLMREVICYKILRNYMPAPRANFVKLRAGTATSMDDIGVYVNVERVNKRFMEKHFLADSGHRYEAVSGSMTWLGTSVSAYASRYDVSGGDPATEYLDLIEVCDVLNHAPISTLAHDLNEVFSVDCAIRQFTAGYALLNWDDLRAFAPNGHNYYLFQDDFHNQMVVLPWDWDLGLSGQPTESIYDLFQDTRLPLVNRLMQDADLKSRYLAFLRTFAENELDWAVIGPWVQQYRSLIESDLLSGDHELYTPSQYHSSHNQLQNQVQGRHTYLLNHADIRRPAPTISEVAYSPLEPTSDEPVWVSARVTGTVAIEKVELHSRAIGPFIKTQMFDDGMHGDGAAGDAVYGASIPSHPGGSTVEYYIEATSSLASGGAKKFEPIYTEHRPLSYYVAHDLVESPLSINECLAKNNSGIQDEAGSFEDWVELYNAGSVSVNLAGYFLTDNLAKPTKWEFPEVTIAAGGYLLIWADDDETNGLLHASFKISAEGEVLGLFSPIADGNRLHDVISFGPQTADVSYGRQCDGETPWVFFDVPTPGVSNDTEVCLGAGADIDGDGDTDLDDYELLAECLGGPDAFPPSHQCTQDLFAGADLDGDGDVDLADFSLFMVRLGT
jgi:hypothetical protein